VAHRFSTEQDGVTTKSRFASKLLSEVHIDQQSAGANAALYKDAYLQGTSDAGTGHNSQTAKLHYPNSYISFHGILGYHDPHDPSSETEFDFPNRRKVITGPDGTVIEDNPPPRHYPQRRK
jgi:hypothetical protein